MEGLVETDNDILALYTVKSHVHSVLETDGETDREGESRTIRPSRYSESELKNNV